MIGRKKRTLDLYKQIGAEARILKQILPQFLVDISKVLCANDNNRAWKYEQVMSSVISNAEDQMFRDYPSLGHDYINVFYGGLRQEPINEVDSEITMIARTYLVNLIADINTEDKLPFDDELTAEELEQCELEDQWSDTIPEGGEGNV